MNTEEMMTHPTVFVANDQATKDTLANLKNIEKLVKKLHAQSKSDRWEASACVMALSEVDDRLLRIKHFLSPIDS